MVLIKAIDSGKEHRKHYRGYLYTKSGYWCPSCYKHSPNSNQCSWCRDNRLHANKRRESAAKDQEREV